MPFLLKAANPHILTLSPPLTLDGGWFTAAGVAYTTTKYGMSLCVLGHADEYAGRIAVCEVEYHNCTKHESRAR